MSSRVGFDDFVAGGATAEDVEGLPSVSAWPELDPAALEGLAGRIVETIDPFSEADRVATLAHVLVALGNIVGPGPHCQVLHDRHPARLYAAIVGESGTSRKGLSWSVPRELFRRVAPAWFRDCLHSGLSSGEGLIAHVRDARAEMQAVRKHGKVVEYQEVIVDHGAPDKRATVLEAELASVYRRMAGEGNSLSAIVRDAWDDRTLRTMTKHSPLKATGAHVSLIGHITKEELLVNLTETDKANGFGNRWLYVLARRSKCIPNAAPVPEHLLGPLVHDLERVLLFADTRDLVIRDPEAEALWGEVYPALSTREPGLVGAMCGRAEAQVLRLSLIYALLDCSPTIGRSHLTAGLAFVDYCVASARRIFGGRLGFSVADTILAALRTRGRLTMDDLYALFSRHKRKDVIFAALTLLEQQSKVRLITEQTGGRSRQLWEAVP